MEKTGSGVLLITNIQPGVSYCDISIHRPMKLTRDWQWIMCNKYPCFKFVNLHVPFSNVN